MVIIDWSADHLTAQQFKARGADGFVWKHRPAPVVADLLSIVKQVRGGSTWVELAVDE